MIYDPYAKLISPARVSISDSDKGTRSGFEPVDQRDQLLDCASMIAFLVGETYET